MAIVGAIFLSIVAFLLFSTGIGALNDSKKHAEYGVETESLHKVFSWLNIALGLCTAGMALALVA